jgi:G3E family GTPase
MNAKSHFPIPITIITGFLGAGKTTLLNRVLHGEHGLRIAVLVNDFGAINIDSQLVVGVEGETISLSNGCICCTIRDDLLTETINLLHRPQPPEYIIIETSGVSDPGAVAMTFLVPEMQEYFLVDSILTLIDAEQVLTLDVEYQALARAQIKVADLVVVNKVDRVSAAQLDAVHDYVQDILPEARVFETTYGQIPLELVMSVGQYAPERLHGYEAQDVHVHAADEEAHDHHHDHDAHEHVHHDHTLVFNTWSWTSDRPFTMESLRTLVDKLPRTIYRAKGVVYLKDYPAARFIMQVVGRRGMIGMAEPWGEHPRRTQMVVIGRAGGVDADVLQRIFESCLATGKPKSRTAQILEAIEVERQDY